MFWFFQFVYDGYRGIFYRNNASAVCIKHRIFQSGSVGSFSCSGCALVHFYRRAKKSPVKNLFFFNDVEVIPCGQCPRVSIRMENLQCLQFAGREQ